MWIVFEERSLIPNKISDLIESDKYEIYSLFSNRSE